METETIKQLKEYKQLLDEGILTQEEFESEKKKLLSAEYSQMQNSNMPVVIEQQEVAECEVEPIRNEPTNKPSHLPSISVTQRSFVMQASTPEEVLGKCDNYLKRCGIGIVIAVILIVAFISICFLGSGWTIFFAILWAVIPAIVLLASCIGSQGMYSNLRTKMEGLNQTEFELLQENIREHRAHERKVVGNIAKEASDIYTKQTGSNLWFDIGKKIINS